MFWKCNHNSTLKSCTDYTKGVRIFHLFWCMFCYLITFKVHFQILVGARTRISAKFIIFYIYPTFWLPVTFAFNDCLRLRRCTIRISNSKMRTYTTVFCSSIYCRFDKNDSSWAGYRHGTGITRNFCFPCFKENENGSITSIRYKMQWKWFIYAELETIQVTVLWLKLSLSPLFSIDFINVKYK